MKKTRISRAGMVQPDEAAASMLARIRAATQKAQAEDAAVALATERRVKRETAERERQRAAEEALSSTADGVTNPYLFVAPLEAPTVEATVRADAQSTTQVSALEAGGGDSDDGRATPPLSGGAPPSPSGGGADEWFEDFYAQEFGGEMSLISEFSATSLLSEASAPVRGVLESGAAAAKAALLDCKPSWVVEEEEAAAAAERERSSQSGSEDSDSPPPPYVSDEESDVDSATQAHVAKAEAEAAIFESEAAIERERRSVAAEREASVPKWRSSAHASRQRRERREGAAAAARRAPNGAGRLAAPGTHLFRSSLEIASSAPRAP